MSRKSRSRARGKSPEELRKLREQAAAAPNQPIPQGHGHSALASTAPPCVLCQQSSVGQREGLHGLVYVCARCEGLPNDYWQKRLQRRGSSATGQPPPPSPPGRPLPYGLKELPTAANQCQPTVANQCQPMTGEPLPTSANQCQPRPTNDGNDNRVFFRKEEEDSSESSKKTHACGNHPGPAPGTTQSASGLAVRLSFGQHKGKTIGEVDDAYLKWLVTTAKIVPPHEREAAAQELLARGKPVAPAGTTDSQVPARTGNSCPKADTGNSRTRTVTDNSRPKADTRHVAAAPSAALLLSAEEVAALLGVSLRTIWRMRERGQLPHPLRLGRQTLRWRREDVEQWIASGHIVLLEAEAATRPSPPTR